MSIFHIDPPAAADPGDEAGIQVRLRSRLRTYAPQIKLIAVPNAGKRSAWEANARKAEGMAKGFCDLIALAPGGRVAFLELKAKKGTLSREQHETLNWLTLAGFNCGCFNSVESAMRALREWGFPFAMAQAA